MKRLVRDELLGLSCFFGLVWVFCSIDAYTGKKYNIDSKTAQTTQVFHQPMKGISGHC